ncbi:M23 family metallopeptidase [Archangium primigenium]|uniref:M23 family metallopeptidase n=1 Tax=[Archangium] primigenium TaxID=2792470 RepID=UPI00195AE363|nr:M23 family metallopeptidase [Archangium primigenium]MBM7113072.1 M23 family metallopeptidase [Archangium primigenium]
MIISTIFLLASAPVVPPTRNTVAPEMGVPFACGRVFPVSQGHDTGSHLQNDTYAWDFRMPIGTPIVSAQDGKVRMARGDSTQGACDPKMASFANYVVVEHAGNVETQYLHFSAVVVKPGDTVRKGQLLGYSGNTGWSCGPHLHFKVASTQGPGWNNPSVPARIAGYGDPMRDTLVAAPVCGNTGELPMMATNDERRASQPLAPVVSTNEGEQASGGIPPGAKEILERVARPAANTLRTPPNAQAFDDGSGGAN